MIVTGGSSEQRAWAWKVMRASNLDLADIDAKHGIEVIFTADIEGAAGTAALNGVVVVDSKPEMGFNAWGSEILAHEFAHLDWHGLGLYRWQSWSELVGPSDGKDWYHNSTESYAEHAKLYSWPPEYLSMDRVRSNLTTLTRQEWETWRYGFKDIAREDTELRRAAWWAKDTGLVKGYEDGTLGPYQPLLRRHVALIVERTGGSLGWDDYAPATRGEVRDAIPGMEWREDRWDETLTRSQLLRLMYRRMQ